LASGIGSPQACIVDMNVTAAFMDMEFATQLHCLSALLLKGYEIVQVIQSGLTGMFCSQGIADHNSTQLSGVPLSGVV
jgi:hypothetical protein